MASTVSDHPSSSISSGGAGASKPSKKFSTMQEESIRDKLHLERFRMLVAWLQEQSDEGMLRKEHCLHLLNQKEFLQLFFQLFDAVQRDDVIVQDTWIESLKARLKEDKHQSDLAELIESVAYGVCGDDDVDVEKFYQIFRAPGVLPKFFGLVDQDQDGVVTANQVMEFIANLTSSRSRSGLTKDNIQWLEKVFRETVGDEKEINLNDFKKIVQSKNSFFSGRVFQIFDRDNSGTISLQEFIDAMHQFAGQSPDDKIKFLFKVYDLDGDGLIQVRELQDVMRACMEENGMQFSEDQIADLVGALVDDADCTEHKDAVTYEALKKLLEKHDGLLQNLSISIDSWLVPPKPKEGPKSLKGKLLAMRPYQLTYPYMKNNYVYLCFLFCFLAVNIGLFVSRAIEYSDYNIYVILARACGQCLNFNCMFVMVLIMRYWITLLRAHGFSAFLPLDQHIYFHQMTGIFIFIYSMIHTIMHLINLTIEVDNTAANVSNLTYWEWLLTTKPGRFGLVKGVAFPTGVVLAVILIIMVICSQSFVRRGGCFEVFYFTHLLYIPFWILTIFHGPNFWKWFVVPCILFLVGRAIKFYKMFTAQGKTYIRSGALLPSKVTHLVIKRPHYFDFNPGDYVFVNVPKVAKYEWHPFTISSAPEENDTICLHIRAVGEWTNGLYDYFSREHDLLMKLGQLVPQLPPLPLHLKDAVDSKDVAESQDLVEQTYVFDGAPDGEDEDRVTPLGRQRSSRKRREPITLAQNPRGKSFSTSDMLSKRERLESIGRMDRCDTEETFHDGKLEKARKHSRESSSAPTVSQTESAAANFRYMRNKPMIVAFQTPSLESQGENVPATALSPLLEDLMEEGKGKTDDSKPELRKPLEIFIDGPYGTPSSHIYRAQHAVLIGTGIGVTPFASILQSIMHRYTKARHTCPKCNHSWAGDIPQIIMNLSKVDFFWINRDQRSFEWFVNLLSKLEIEQAELGETNERFLDMHMYITSALEKTDMKAVGLQLALDLLHEKEKRDLITGLKTRTNAGRPNWTKVFKQIADQKKGKVTVFYCGPPALARVLRIKCDEFGFRFSKENF